MIDSCPFFLANPVVSRREICYTVMRIINHLLSEAKLEYTSSAGIRQIVAIHKQMKGALTLRNVTPEVKAVLQMIGLDKRLHIEP